MRYRIMALLILLGFAFVLWLGCSDDTTGNNNPGVESCSPGTRLPCKCAEWQYGISYCNWDGNGWSICDCSYSGGDGGPDGGGINYDPVDAYVPDDNTMMLWHMDQQDVYQDDGGLPMLKDSSGNGFDGILENGPKTGVPGPVDTAIQFDGEDDMIRIDVSSDLPDAGSTVLDTFTVEFWVWIQETGSGITVNRDGEGEESQVWQIGINGSGQVVFRTELNAGSPREHRSIGKVDDGRFHHVAATRDNGTGLNQIYIDGDLDVTFDGGIGPLSGTDTMSIGRHYNPSDYDDPFQGVLDEIRISSKVRDPSEFNLP